MWLFHGQSGHLAGTYTISFISNQSHVYTANIPGIARLSGTTVESVFNSEVDEGEPKSKRYVSKHFRKITIEI